MDSPSQSSPPYPAARRFGCEVRRHREVPSTIDAAWQWLSDGGPEGAAVIAERQTRGRGRLGRPWASPPGGLWMSIIARPGISASQAGRLGIALCLAAAGGVREESGCEAGVKWPNDIVTSGRKLGGVLIETKLDADRVSAAVLSVGLNVNFPQDRLPPEVRHTATTLLDLTGRTHDLDSLAGRVFASLTGLWRSVLGDGAELVSAWRQRDVLWSSEVAVEVGRAALRGFALGIDPDGALVLQAGGDRRLVPAGEVTALRSPAP